MKKEAKAKKKEVVVRFRATLAEKKKLKTVRRKGEHTLSDVLRRLIREATKGT